MELEAARCAILPQLIERHLATTGQAPSRFGREALSDPCLVSDMRLGRQVTRATKLRILAYMDGQHKPSAKFASRWLPEHDELLWQAVINGATRKQIGAQLGRTSQAIKDRLEILKDTRIPWRPQGFRMSSLRAATLSGDTSL